MDVNIIFAFLFGAGIFFIVVSFSYRVGKSAFDRLDRSRGFQESEQPSAYQPVDRSSRALYRIFRRKGLGAVLDQAELNISEASFLRFSVLILAVGYLGAILVTGGWAVSAALALLCEFLFVYWLINRREAKRRAYDEALAEMCDHMSAGAMIENNVPGAIDFALEMAPENVKADFEEVRKNLTNLGISKSFAAIRERRNSRVLDILADGLDIWGGEKGSTEPLSAILEPIRNTVIELTSERNRLESELSGAMQQAAILSVAPLGFVAYMRANMAGYSEYFATSEGQLLQFCAYALAAGGYLLAQRTVNRVRQIWGS